MKLGLLQCDVVMPEFLPIDGDFSDMIEKLLWKHREDFELVVYRVNDQELPGSVNDCDAYVGGGSRNSVFQEEEWIQQFQHFVSELNAHHKKFLGICFSHQMIAQALGGQVERPCTIDKKVPKLYLNGANDEYSSVDQFRSSRCFPHLEKLL